MSKKVRILVCSMLVLVAFGAGIFAYAHTQLKQNTTAKAEESLPDYFVDKDGKIIVPTEPATGDVRNSRGTAENPFFVLEIVPYEGMAEFGYQISGCEPIDVDAAARDGIDIPGQGTYYTTEYGVEFRFWPEEKPDTFPGTQTDKMTQYGTMTYVDDGSGQYKMTGEYTEGDDLTKVTYEKVAEGEEGSFLWKPESAEKCFAMTDADKAPYEGEFTGELTPGTSYKMYFEEVEYIKGSGNKLTHSHTFLEESVGLAYAYDTYGVRYRLTDEEIADKVKDYKSIVYTVTPEDLNMNPELINRADLLVITSQASMLPTLGDCPDGFYTEAQPGDADIYGDDGKVMEKYRYVPYFKKHLFGYEDPTGQYGRKENKPGATFKSNLLDWSIVLKIYERATDETHILPIVTENKIFQNAFDSAATPLVKSNVKIKAKFADGSTKETANFTGTLDNLVKLYLMLYQTESTVFEVLNGDPTDSSNAKFSSQDLVLANGNKVRMKNNNYVQTGVFNYDNGRPNPQKGTADSRVYWNDLTMLPWHLMPNDDYTSVEKYGKAVAAYGIAVRSGNYDMTGTSAQNSIRNGVMAFFGDMKLTTGLDTQSCDVKNNAFGAQLYEFFDAINGAEPAPAEGTLTTADCLYYLLGGVNGGPTPVNDTTKYKILELQPSSSYERDTNADFWKLMIAVYTNSIVEPEVKQMTTSEFIGSHVECISEYDLIYVGMKKSSTEPTMKFTSGTNYVYSHTGPEVTAGTGFRAIYGWLRSEKLSGISNNDYDRKEQKFAYSGNDLTSLAYAKLEAYHEAGFPVMFGDGFYSGYSGGSYTMANTIDRNSNIYKLGGIIDDAGTKAVYYGELGINMAKTEVFRQTLTSNSQKVQMVFEANGLPVLYDSNTPDIRDRYINGYNNSNRTLRYKFYLKAPAGTSYEVKLYVDANTDGTYSTDREDMGVTIYGEGVSGDTIQAGKEYTVERQITNRIGSIPWKLDLVKDGKVYASQSGVSAIQKGPGDDVITIKVLQITPDSATVSLSLPEDQEDADSIGGASKTFYEKIDDLDCFDVFFTRMTQDEVKNVINGTPGVAAQPDYLYQTYDMLVLGFGDMYDGVSDEMLLAKIENFIDRGKAVLYTHDTSSTIGRPGSNFSVWGSNVTKAYRDMFGMDRYGAKIYFDTGNLSSEDMNKKDKPYKPANSSASAGRLYKNEDNIPYIQGLSNGLLFRATNEHIKAYEVSRVNTGAITQYPFTIPDKIDVAMTHPQYYQLDMERNDMVVWYCLDGGTPGKSSTKETTFFGQNKNDVRNNYYIYNVGNVTYSGMGHMDGDTANALALTDLEIELFINTFVAAYRASAMGVPVKVVNEDVTSNSAGDQFLCVDVDSSNATESIGIDIVDGYRIMEADGTGYDEVATPAAHNRKSKRVYFYLNDTNAYGDDTEYRVSMKLNGKSFIQFEEDGPEYYLAVYRKSDGKFIDSDVRKYKKGDHNSNIYYVDVPITIDTVGGVSAVGKTVLEVTVEMTYFVGEESYEGEPKTTTINILPRGLYDLH